MTRVIRHARFSDVTVLVGRLAHLVQDVEGRCSTREDDPSEDESAPLLDPEMVAADLEAERQADIEEAFDRGLRTGREEGRRAAEEELRSAVNNVTRLADQLAAEREAVLRDAHDLVVHLSCAIARRIIEVSALVDTAGVIDAISESVSHVADRSSLTIKVHPDDLDVVSRHCAESLAKDGGVGKVTFEGDAGISRGGCVVDTDSGIVDGRVESQLKLLRDELLGKVRGE